MILPPSNHVKWLTAHKLGAKREFHTQIRTWCTLKSKLLISLRASCATSMITSSFQIKRIATALKDMIWTITQMMEISKISKNGIRAINQLDNCNLSRDRWFCFKKTQLKSNFNFSPSGKRAAKIAHCRSNRPNRSQVHPSQQRTKIRTRFHRQSGVSISTRCWRSTPATRVEISAHNPISISAWHQNEFCFPRCLES